MGVTDLEAFKKWSQIPKDLKLLIKNNVFCVDCYVTKIVDYTIQSEEFGILLKGKCAKCGQEVARLVEDE